ncbi:MAG: peroxiredoxin-like family protein [Capsulimonadaceae bacterium]|nr:peroxiredoxin-like family protein [Capsulimonadaceae bacterium]
MTDPIPVKQQTQGAQLDSGVTAPDCALTGVSGNTVMLSDYWQRSPVILVFLRNYGCTFCKEQVLELRNNFGKIKRSGAQVVCIAKGTHQLARAFQILFDLPFDILVCGDDASVFRAYGLSSIGLTEIFRWRVWKRLFLCALNGIYNNPFGVQPGRMERTGGFLIDTNGKILFAHRAEDVSDIAEADLLLSYVPVGQSQLLRQTGS